jgi:hypothetical protein
VGSPKDGRKDYRRPLRWVQHQVCWRWAVRAMVRGCEGAVGKKSLCRRRTNKKPLRRIATRLPRSAYPGGVEEFVKSAE